MKKGNVVSKKRFIISKKMIGQGLQVEVETRTGNTTTKSTSCFRKNSITCLVSKSMATTPTVTIYLSLFVRH